MIFTNSESYPIDGLNSDTMDSALRASILALNSPDFGKYKLSLYYNWNGTWVRCPEGEPANNAKNLSRDNMIPLLAATAKTNMRYILKQTFYATLRRFRLGCGLFSFAQNTERDKIGSTKYMWPHWFFKDSKPIEHTQKLNIKEVFQALQNKHPAQNSPGVEFRWFDGPDILAPNHMGIMVIGGRIWRFYPLLPIYYFFHFLALIGNIGSKKEQNQLILESFVYGTKRLYGLLQPNYAALTRKYWAEDRNEEEYGEILIKLIEEA